MFHLPPATSSSPNSSALWSGDLYSWRSSSATKLNCCGHTSWWLRWLVHASLHHICSSDHILCAFSSGGQVDCSSFPFSVPMLSGFLGSRWFGQKICCWIAGLWTRVRSQRYWGSSCPFGGGLMTNIFRSGAGWTFSGVKHSFVEWLCCPSSSFCRSQNLSSTILIEWNQNLRTCSSHAVYR